MKSQPILESLENRMLLSASHAMLPAQTTTDSSGSDATETEGKGDTQDSAGGDSGTEKGDSSSDNGASDSGNDRTETETKDTGTGEDNGTSEDSGSGSSTGSSSGTAASAVTVKPAKAQHKHLFSTKAIRLKAAKMHVKSHLVVHGARRHR